MCWYAAWLNQSIDDLSAVVLACLGFLSPANRGALMTCAVVLWVLLGTPAGYVSARLYKSKSLVKTFQQMTIGLDSRSSFFFIFSVCLLSFRRWKVEVECPADSALVPRVSSAAEFAHLIRLISRCSVYAFILPSVLPHTYFLPLCPCLSPKLCPPESFSQTSSWWTWSFGWRGPPQRSPSALWWQF